MRVLIVEDERKMAAALRRGLEEENHTVSVAFDGPSGLEFAARYDFDVILLDVMLPGMDGYEVSRRLRAAGRQAPIVMLTARDATQDIVRGLDAGADDYLTKPFAFDELLARLRAAARRKSHTTSPALTVADLTLDPVTREVVRNGRTIQLTATEFRLLECLMRSAGRVVPRDALVDAVWGPGSAIESNTLEAFVRLLRKKIDGPFADTLIQTVRGVGYRMRAGRLS
jgi:two-component system, OmpR family, response regulator